MEGELTFTLSTVITIVMALGSGLATFFVVKTRLAVVERRMEDSEKLNEEQTKKIELIEKEDTALKTQQSINEERLKNLDKDNTIIHKRIDELDNQVERNKLIFDDHAKNISKEIAEMKVEIIREIQTIKN